MGQTPSVEVQRANVLQNAIESGNAPAVEVQRADDRGVETLRATSQQPNRGAKAQPATAKNPASRDGVRPSKEGQSRTGFTIPNPDGRGPSTLSYGVDDWYWDLLQFPLNNVGNYNYLSGYVDDYVTGGDYVDGYWYVVDEYINQIYKINPATGSATTLPINVFEYVRFGMAYNDVEGVAYVVGSDASIGDPNNFYRVNLNTGETQYAFMLQPINM